MVQRSGKGLCTKKVRQPYGCGERGHDVHSFSFLFVCILCIFHSLRGLWNSCLLFLAFAQDLCPQKLFPNDTLLEINK